MRAIAVLLAVMFVSCCIAPPSANESATTTGQPVSMIVHNGTCMKPVECFVVWCRDRPQELHCMDSVQTELYGANCTDRGTTMWTENNYTACDCISGYCRTQ